MSADSVSPELLAQVRRDRELISEEVPAMAQRYERMSEAGAENTFSGHLRRAIHSSGRLLREVAIDAGVSSQELGEFLEGTRTLRSDVMDRLAQAVGATITVEPRRLER